MVFAKRQLEACGVEADTAEEIILYVAALRTELGRTEFIPEAAATAAKKYRDKVCRGAGQAKFRMTQRGVNHAFNVAALRAAGYALIIPAQEDPRE